MIVFTHVPRTGGTSIRAFISERVARHAFMDALSDFAFVNDAELAGYDFVATHCGFGVFRRFPTARRLIVLRDPVERIVSYYYYLRGLEANISYASHYAKSLPLAEFASLSNPAVRVGVENAQVWHLVEDKNIGFRNRYKQFSDGEAVDAAFANLLTYDTIGFYESLRELFERLAVEFPGPAASHPHLAASVRPALADIDAATLDVVRSQVASDELLYRRAREHFHVGS